MELFYVLIYDVLLFQRALLVFFFFSFLASLRIGWEVPAVNEEGEGTGSQVFRVKGQVGREKKEKKGASLET